MSYKRIAKLVHPDKGGSEVMFNTVTECFRKLAHEYKAREEKTFDQLKKGSRDYYQQFHQPPENTSGRDTSHRTESLSNKTESDKTVSFIERFNRAFEDNRLEDDDGSSMGYGDKMAASSKVREDIAIPRVMKKFEAKTFNSVFDAITIPDTQDVVRYIEPEPLPLAKKIQYTELGKGATDDFSSTQEGEGRRTLQYTDYMKAYTTQRLVDPRSVQERKAYRSVDEYESARSDAYSRPMTDDERSYRETREQELEKREYDRLMRLKERDSRQTAHFDKVNRLVLR
jgi:hypothetical protein